MRHYLSYSLRTTYSFNRQLLDDAADELDRLNNLVIEMAAQAAENNQEYRDTLVALNLRIKECEQNTKLPQRR